MKLVRYNYPTMNAARDFGSLLGDFRGFFPDVGEFWQEPASAEVPADLYDDEAHVYARFELPGFKKDEIRLSAENGFLTLNVERKAAREGGESLSLTRAVELPEDVAADKTTAKYEDGVLTVTIPKTAEKKAKLIAIE
jgi:HSP20 family protein